MSDSTFLSGVVSISCFVFETAFSGLKMNFTAGGGWFTSRCTNFNFVKDYYGRVTSLVSLVLGDLYPCLSSPLLHEYLMSRVPSLHLGSLSVAAGTGALLMVDLGNLNFTIGCAAYAGGGVYFPASSSISFPYFNISTSLFKCLIVSSFSFKSLTIFWSLSFLSMTLYA